MAEKSTQERRGSSLLETPLTIEIVAPTGPVWKGRARGLVAPAVDGEVGILHLRAPMIAALGTGVLRLDEAGREHRIYVDGGFLEVLRDRVVVLAENAAVGSSIDVERAKAALTRARGLIEKGGPEVDRRRARRALVRAQARLQAAGGWATAASH